MKLIPASSARWTMRTQSAWSRLPIAPNIIAPRQSRLTRRPERPRVSYCMGVLLGRPARAARQGTAAAPAPPSPGSADPQVDRRREVALHGELERLVRAETVDVGRGPVLGEDAAERLGAVVVEH